MFQLCCTVRNCYEDLVPREGGLFCESGHHFNQARQGYWNLLQPQDSKSRSPGDCDAAVLSRASWLGRGHMSGLVERLRDWVKCESQRSEDPILPRIMELGCGEGTLSADLFANQASGYCGIDLSKRAIKLAARQMPDATWVLANADRFLPANDDSVDRVVSLFGRRPVDEIVRVLRPGGFCVVAVPAPEDLAELRELVQLAASKRSRCEAIISQMRDAGLVLREQKAWQHQVSLNQEALVDAMTMTYRGVRHSQQARLESADGLDITLAADLLLFEKQS